MIFLVLLFVGACVYAFISFWGLLFGGIVARRSMRYKKGLIKGLSEPPEAVHILKRPKSYDWEQELEGWDAAEELEIDEDI